MKHNKSVLLASSSSDNCKLPVAQKSLKEFVALLPKLKVYQEPYFNSNSIKDTEEAYGRDAKFLVAHGTRRKFHRVGAFRRGYLYK